MSDREFGGNDDLSLPKATVQKIITEILPPNGPSSANPNNVNPTFSRDARDLLIDCCVEFIRMLSSEANDLSEKEAKKTIAVEHVERALNELGFGDYVAEVLESAGEFRDMQKTREKRVNKLERSGMSDEDLLRMQEEMFASARDKFNSTGGSEGGPA